jgi:hypothetical protein
MAVMIRAWAALALVGWAAAVGLVAVELMVKMSASVAGCRAMVALVALVGDKRSHKVRSALLLYRLRQ